MLSSANTGKLLSKTYHRERAKAVGDKTNFTAAEQTYLDITGTEGTKANQKETFQIAQTPIDSNPIRSQEERPEKIDIRLFSQMGGNI